MQVVAAETATGHAIWLANLTGEATSVSVRAKIGQGQLFVLDAEAFTAAAIDADAAEHLSKPFDGGSVALGPYAVACITGT